ncbi:hypothetical protein [Microvirga pudoricolor]|uniref:hypothetical protein n=1 Tax=Microvirga pudoricolor TaxID=2778729 RepID=UPI0019516156|nr:hypothetical protein [Microvirga pudoricolor]MBM6595430.1 hypothetical protein [Microvirga pudoricolor]
MTTDFTFTAANSQQLAKQLRSARTIEPRMHFHFGPDGDGGWWTYGEDEAKARLGLSFRSLVAHAQTVFDEIQETARRRGPFDITSIRFDTAEDLLNEAIEGSIARPMDEHDPVGLVYKYDVMLVADVAERIGVNSVLHVTMWDWKAYSIGTMMSDKNAWDGRPRTIIASAMQMSEDDQWWFSADVASWAIAKIAARLDYLTEVITGHDPEPSCRLPGWHPNDERKLTTSNRRRAAA